MLQMVRRYGFVVVVALMFAGCDGIDVKGLVVPTGDVVDSRFEQSMTLTGGGAVASVAAEEEYMLYVGSDVHIAEEYGNMQQFTTLLRNDSEATFGVMLGDCIDKRGSMPLYVKAIEYKSSEQERNLPIFTVLGNHDTYFSGWNAFRDALGASVYWFEVLFATGRDLYIVLDTATGTLGGKQSAWLREMLATKRNEYRHCLILTHTNLFYTDNSQLGSGNLPLEESASLYSLFSDNRVTLCLQGHDHYREDVNLGGVRYVIVGTMREEAKPAEYLRLSVTPEGVVFDWRYLD